MERKMNYMKANKTRNEVIMQREKQCYYLLFLNAILFIAWFIIAYYVPAPSANPFLGNFILIMFYGGVIVLAILFLLALPWIRLLWLMVAVVVYILEWILGASIFCWAFLQNEMYTGFFITAPLVFTPICFLGAVFYCLIKLFLRKRCPYAQNMIETICWYSFMIMELFVLLLFIGLYIYKPSEETLKEIGRQYLQNKYSEEFKDLKLKYEGRDNGDVSSILKYYYVVDSASDSSASKYEFKIKMTAQGGIYGGQKGLLLDQKESRTEG